ncbi:MAG: hypothetical protein ACXWKB_06165 [Methyloceanibacter sp.]
MKKGMVVTMPATVGGFGGYVGEETARLGARGRSGRLTLHHAFLTPDPGSSKHVERAWVGRT